MCLTTVFAMTNENNIEPDYNTKGITINYQIVNFPQNQKPIKINNTTYVPLDFFAKKLGYDVQDYLDYYLNIGGGDIVQCSVQRDLLKDAMSYVGVDTPKKAVDVWSEGLKQRSAAIQYSVMTKELKDIYEKDLKERNANWVTGMSSPWVDSHEITNEKKVNDKTQIFEVKYNTATSAGESEPFTVILEVIKDNDFWHISKVNGDESSTAYTGFKDKS
jgi:hypothetical protein